MAMLGSSKPAASLSSGLLARKGQARPAMRPQGYHGTSLNLEDLGWNDMGDEPVAPAPVVAIAPASASIAPAATIMPPVLVEREELREGIEAGTPEPAVAKPTPETVRPVSLATAARIDREVRAGKARAAFTLRLDAERHLRLRLASASRNRSAQALVVEALDAFIASLPEVEGLAAQLTPAKAQGRKS